MSEIDTAFEDVEKAMAPLGTAVTFTVGGKNYAGVIGTSDLATQMLTGAYNGRSQLVIRATKPQFIAAPPQRGLVMVYGSDGSKEQWECKEMDPNQQSHYVFTLIRGVSP